MDQKRGRPGLLHPLLIRNICKDLQAGNYKRVAAEANGIDPTTFSHWEKRGWADIAKGATGTIYAGFCQAVKKADSLGEKALLAIIRASKPGTWQGAAWILERTKPDRYARRERIDLTIARREIAALSDRELTGLARKAALSQGTTLELIEGAEGFSLPDGEVGG